MWKNLQAVSKVDKCEKSKENPIAKYFHNLVRITMTIVTKILFLLKNYYNCVDKLVNR